MERQGNYAERPGSALDWKTPSITAICAIVPVAVGRLATGYPVKPMILALLGVAILAVGLWANYYASTRTNSFMFTKDMLTLPVKLDNPARTYQKRHGQGPYCVNAFVLRTAHSKVHLGYDVMLMLIVYWALMFFTGGGLTETAVSSVLAVSVPYAYNWYKHGDIDVTFKSTDDDVLKYVQAMHLQ
jgi:hypothetical protein